MLTYFFVLVLIPVAHYENSQLVLGMGLLVKATGEEEEEEVLNSQRTYMPRHCTRPSCTSLGILTKAISLFYILISKKAACYEVYGMHTYSYIIFFARALCLIHMIEESYVYFCRQNLRESVFSLHVSWGLCFFECRLGRVHLCVLE